MRTRSLSLSWFQADAADRCEAPDNWVASNGGGVADDRLFARLLMTGTRHAAPHGVRKKGPVSPDRRWCGQAGILGKTVPSKPRSVSFVSVASFLAPSPRALTPYIGRRRSSETHSKMPVERLTHSERRSQR
jgi:hypothetical protein